MLDKVFCPSIVANSLANHKFSLVSCEFKYENFEIKKITRRGNGLIS